MEMFPINIIFFSFFFSFLQKLSIIFNKSFSPPYWLLERVKTFPHFVKYFLSKMEIYLSAKLFRAELEIFTSHDKRNGTSRDFIRYDRKYLVVWNDKNLYLGKKTRKNFFLAPVLRRSGRWSFSLLYNRRQILS